MTEEYKVIEDMKTIKLQSDLKCQFLCSDPLLGDD
jgi:hypothetical protein